MDNILKYFAFHSFNTDIGQIKNTVISKADIVNEIIPTRIIVPFTRFNFPASTIIAIITCAVAENPPIKAFKNIATEPPIDTADVPFSPSFCPITIISTVLSKTIIKCERRTGMANFMR